MLRRAVILICFGVLFPSVKPASAFQLITEQEAALPDHSTVTVTRGGLTRRPEILVLSPVPDAGFVTSPLHLKLKIRAFGGAIVDRESIVISYRKAPPINLTQRVTSFLKRDEIDIPDAEIPPGTHRFRISIMDKDGRFGSSDFVISVRK